jgi:hypothetical protein
LEDRTQARFDAAKENNYIEYVGKRAVGAELEQLAHEDDPITVMRALEKEGWLKVLHPHLTVAKAEASDLGHAIKLRQALSDLGYSAETGPMAMYFLAKKLTDKDASEIQRMIPRRDFVEKWKHLEKEAHDLAKKLTGKEASSNSGSWKILSAAAPENILFLSMTTRQSAIDQKIKNFMTKWRQVREKLPFPEMAELRITAQLPEYPKILDEAFLLLMDGKLRSHNEIMNFLKPYEPPPPPPPPPARRGRGKAAVVEAAPVAAPVVVAAIPGKRGRKPKAGAPVPAAPVAVEPAKPVAAAKTAPEAKKAAPVKVAKKVEKPAKKAAPAKAKPVPKKVAAKKPAAKEPAPKKPAAKRPVAKKAAKKKR